MSQVPVTDRGGVGQGLVAERQTARDKPKQQLIMFASPVRRAGSSLGTTLKRLRMHNRAVTSVVLDSQSATGNGKPPARIIAYLRDGLLVAFDIEDADKALLAGALVMRSLRGAELVDGDGVESRIGLSVGEIAVGNYHADAPEDRSGMPIEIAAQLVSDIAKPGQIVLDSSTQRQIDVDLVALREVMPKAVLHPLEGEALTIDGMTDQIPIFELIWDGEQRDIHNRRQLARELAKIRSATFELRFKLKDERQDLSRRDLDEDRVLNFDRLVQELDPAKPKDSSERFEEEWDGAGEAQKIEELVEKKREILGAYEELKKVWLAKRAEVRGGGVQGKRAGAACNDAYANFCGALERFFDQLSWHLDEIEKTL